MNGHHDGHYKKNGTSTNYRCQAAGENQRLITSRLPLPCTVQVYNWVWPQRTEKIGTNNAKTLRHQGSSPWSSTFRPEHSVDLLQTIRLELLVDSSTERSLEESPGERDDNVLDSCPRVVYSQTVSTGTVQPVWRYLNEAIDTESSDTRMTIDEYDSMTLRFSIDNKHPLFQIPIHPSKLVRLKAPLPEQLPLNLIAVQFSDNSIRIPGFQHDLLREQLGAEVKKEINHNNHMDRKNGDGDDDDHLAARFEDTVFRTLDRVTPATSPVRRDAGSLLDQVQDVSSLLDQTLVEKAETLALRKNEHDAGSLDDILDAQLVAEENRALRDLIRQHEAIFQTELDHVKESTERIKSLKDELTLQTNRLELVHEANSEFSDMSSLRFQLQAHQIRLIRELQTIYPVSSNGRGGFTIRGLEIPIDILSPGQLSEDELSAALGYLCHTVHMMSKYLAVQFRYRLLCHCSRSYIQDERAILYPLFLGRNVDREQLQHGVSLLHRNVECLCQERGIKVAPKLHVLGKLKRVFEHVTEGY